MMKDKSEPKIEPYASRRKRITRPVIEKRRRSRYKEVKGLYVLPDGPSFAFDNVRDEGKAVKMITVGADPSSDIALTDERIGDPTISSNHCLLDRQGHDWIVRDSNSTNHTLVNDVVVESCRLHPGSLLTLGNTNLVAYGRGGFNGLVSIVGFSVHSLIHRARKYHRTIERSGDQVGVPSSTLWDWLTNRFRLPPKGRSEQ